MTDLAGQAVAGPGRSASRSGATIFRGSIGKNAEHPDHQIQRHRMHEQPEQICHEPVITQALATQVDLQFLVSVLAFSTLGVVVIDIKGGTPRTDMEPASPYLSTHQHQLGVMAIFRTPSRCCEKRS